MAAKGMLEKLGEIGRRVERSFREQGRVLSFQEYLEHFADDPVGHSRDAARYVRDMFDHFGTEPVERPWAKMTRFKLFDLPWLGDSELRRDALVGQESVQAEVYRVLCNFVREGRPNRLVLMHGPNGSAKSTVAACIMRGLERYSELDEGALYRFHWVFPSQGLVKGSIGFAGRRGGDTATGASYAHLTEDQIDARLFMEVRDHPMLLIPYAERAELLESIFSAAGATSGPPDWLLKGYLSHKGRQVFDALMMSCDGSLEEVLRHVQVERYFISRRYRVGAVTLGPQLSVDAGERQITADRSLSALPSALQAVTLFEAHGELVDAAGGVLEFSDLLKRPIDAFKYLQITAETGEVALRSQNVRVNCVMVASANEEQLKAFREHHEFASFRGRLELVRCGYLRSWRDEQAIYDAQIVPQVRKHVAPHATEVAAMFAVLTRMQQPQAAHYDKPLAAVVEELTAIEKVDLYATGKAPARLDEESAKLLRSSVNGLYRESDAYPNYEGEVGASPREMRGVLLDAAQNPLYECLSPFAVLAELDRLCDRSTEYAWLNAERRPGGYHDHAQFRELLKQRLLDSFEDEIRVASGLVDEHRYADLFDRYLTHVSFWSKGEELRNELTGGYEEPDERLMEGVEELLGGPDQGESLRNALMNRIAAWAIDHPGQTLDNSAVFGPELVRLRKAVFEDRRVAVAKLTRAIVTLLRGEGSGLDDAQRSEAQATIDALKSRFGYQDVSVADASVVLVRERYADLLT